MITQIRRSGGEEWTRIILKMRRYEGGRQLTSPPQTTTAQNKRMLAPSTVYHHLRSWVRLRREKWGVNRKRVRRLYRLDELQLRMRVRQRNHMALHRGPAPLPTGPTERSSMDFVYDALSDGRPVLHSSATRRSTV